MSISLNRSRLFSLLPLQQFLNIFRHKFTIFLTFNPSIYMVFFSLSISGVKPLTILSEPLILSTSLISLLIWRYNIWGSICLSKWIS